MNVREALRPLAEKIPGAMGYYRYLRDLKALNREVEYREKLGFFFNGNSSMEKGEFEPYETAIIDSLIASFDLFVNVGANTGYYACRALHKGIPTLAYEPNQLNVNMLLRNIDANKFEVDFYFFPLALSNQVGVLPMYGASTGASLIDGWAGQKNSYLVPISTFDRTASLLVDGKSCLILIDVEGAELSCLRGSRALLASSRNNVFLVEVTVSVNQPSGTKINPHLVDTFSLMTSYGYEAYTADPYLRRIELSEVRAVAKSGKNTFGVHNFIFLKNRDILKEISFD